MAKIRQSAPADEDVNVFTVLYFCIERVTMDIWNIGSVGCNTSQIISSFNIRVQTYGLIIEFEKICYINHHTV